MVLIVLFFRCPTLNHRNRVIGQRTNPSGGGSTAPALVSPGATPKACDYWDYRLPRRNIPQRRALTLQCLTLIGNQAGRQRYPMVENYCFISIFNIFSRRGRKRKKHSSPSSEPNSSSDLPDPGSPPKRARLVITETPASPKELAPEEQSQSRALTLQCPQRSQEAAGTVWYKWSRLYH